MTKRQVVTAAVVVALGLYAWSGLDPGIDRADSKLLDADPAGLLDVDTRERLRGLAHDSTWVDSMIVRVQRMLDSARLP